VGEGVGVATFVYYLRCSKAVAASVSALNHWHHRFCFVLQVCNVTVWDCSFELKRDKSFSHQACGRIMLVVAPLYNVVLDLRTTQFGFHTLLCRLSQLLASFLVSWYVMHSQSRFLHSVGTQYKTVRKCTVKQNKCCNEKMESCFYFLLQMCGRLK